MTGEDGGTAAVGAGRQARAAGRGRGEELFTVGTKRTDWAQFLCRPERDHRRPGTGRL